MQKRFFGGSKKTSSTSKEDELRSRDRTSEQVQDVETKSTSSPSVKNGQDSQQQVERTPAEQQEEQAKQQEMLNSLVFNTQLAHGSPTRQISGFRSVEELYSKLATAFELEPGQILFCTLNTHRIDMECLLTAQLCLDDFIFVHLKGPAKKVTVNKSTPSLGLTITDNGAGLAFIKRIKEGSLIREEYGNSIQVGDHLSELNGSSLIGLRHIDVARALKAIPEGEEFELLLNEPIKSGFGNISPRDKSPGAANLKSGRETLRFHNNRVSVSMETAEDVARSNQAKLSAIATKLESYMGIQDEELTGQINAIKASSSSLKSFIENVECSDLADFDFSAEFLEELYAI